MIDKLQKDYDALSSLKRELGRVYAEAQEKLAEDRVFANKNAANQFLKDVDVDESTRTESKRIGELQTIASVEAEIAKNRTALLRESESPDFKAERQRQLQSLIGAGMSRREALLDRVRPPVNTEEQLRLQESARAGRNFSTDLGMVDDVAGLKDALYALNRTIDEESKSTGFTSERQAELLGERQQVQDRIDAIGRQKVQEDIDRQMTEFRKGSMPAKFSFTQLGDHLMQSLAASNADKLAKEHLAELRKQTGALQDVKTEIAKKRPTVAVAG